MALGTTSLPSLIHGQYQITPRVVFFLARDINKPIPLFSIPPLLFLFLSHRLSLLQTTHIHTHSFTQKALLTRLNLNRDPTFTSKYQDSIRLLISAPARFVLHHTRLANLRPS